MKVLFYRIFLLFLVLSTTFFTKKLFAVDNNIMPLSQIKKGMKGKAITVFFDQKREEFNVEILSIIYDTAPKQTMILARFTGKNVERSGIAEGMSGSPVYINGKLIGAIAYTWPNLKEAIGGIQPIEQMLPVLKEPISYPTFSAKEGLSIGELRNPAKDMQPIDVPLVVSGFSDGAFKIVRDDLLTKGIKTVQGNSSNGSFPTVPKTQKKTNSPKKLTQNKNSLSPGDAVGILLMRGDASASAIGTVTYIDSKDKNKVLIFGHPFQELGYIQFPMTKASIHYIMPSTQIAWKFASADEIIGTIYNDRKTAVAGKIGISPSLIPVNVKIYDTDQKEEYQFKYEMVNNGNFLPNLFAGAVVNSLGRFGSKEYQTLKVDATIQIKNRQTKKKDTILLSNYLAGNGEIITKGISSMLMQPLQQLLMNLYSEVEIIKIDSSVYSVNNMQIAKISQAMVVDSQAKPGEKAKVRLILNTFQNKKEIITLEVPIPEGYDKPILPVTITGGIIAEANIDNFYAGSKEPSNYEQLLESLNQNVSGKDLVLFYDTQAITANIDGYLLKNLPLSKAYDFGVKQQTNKYYGAVRHSFAFPTNYLVAGQAQVMIPVKI